MMTLGIHAAERAKSGLVFALATVLLVAATGCTRTVVVREPVYARTRVYAPASYCYTRRGPWGYQTVCR
jgi:hypothetical protein